MQKLYAQIFSQVDGDSFVLAYYDGILDFDIDTAYLDEMFALVIQKQDHIIHIIHRFAPKFEIETMLKTNILAMGIALSEMLWFSWEIPAKVSINEAIELAKYFWDEHQKKIVNGILNSALEEKDSLEQNLESGEKKYSFFS